MILRKLKGIHSRLDKYLKYRFYYHKALSYLADPKAYLNRRQALFRMRLPENLKDHVTDLRRTGFSRIPTSFNGELLQSVNEAVQKKVAEALRPDAARAGSSTKAFFSQLLTPADWTGESVFLRFALQDAILQVAASYIGQVPVLSRLELILSNPATEDWSKSQLWHRDYDDTRMLKFFTYFTPVLSDEDGPFTFIPADKTAKLKIGLLPIHKTETMIEKAGGGNQAMKVYAPALSSFFIDTHRCLHMGSRLKPGKHRVALIVTFNTFARLVPYESKLRADRPLPPLQSLVMNQ